MFQNKTNVDFHYKKTQCKPHYHHKFSGETDTYCWTSKIYYTIFTRSLSQVEYVK